MMAPHEKLTHICGSHDYAVVHRLVTPARGLLASRGKPLACGRRLTTVGAGWVDYPEDRHGMCKRCRAAL